MNSWLIDWVIGYVKAHGPAVAVKITKEAILPYAKEQAAKTGNKFDDYAVKQLERILNDPELIALVEGVS